MTSRRRKLLRIAAATLGVVVAIAGVGFGVKLAAFRRDVVESEARWAQERPRPLGDLGTTRTLTILPLPDEI